MYKNPADFFLGVTKTKEVVTELADRFEAEAAKALDASCSQEQGDRLLMGCRPFWSMVTACAYVGPS